MLYYIMTFTNCQAFLNIFFKVFICSYMFIIISNMRNSITKNYKFELLASSGTTKPLSSLRLGVLYCYPYFWSDLRNSLDLENDDIMINKKTELSRSFLYCNFYHSNSFISPFIFHFLGVFVSNQSTGEQSSVCFAPITIAERKSSIISSV